jgi:hypothetical protein
MVLVPVLTVGMWIALLNADSPDVPDPSWADWVFGAVAFFSNYPWALMGENWEKYFSELLRFDGRFPMVRILLDGIFWAFVMVSVGFVLSGWQRGGGRSHRLSRMNAHRRIMAAREA